MNVVEQITVVHIISYLECMTLDLPMPHHFYLHTFTSGPSTHHRWKGLWDCWDKINLAWYVRGQTLIKFPNTSNYGQVCLFS